MIRLLHPVAPFITEELFQLLKQRFPNLKSNDEADPYTRTTLEALLSPACIIAPYPTLICESDLHPEIEGRFALLENIVYALRNIRGEMNIPPGTATDLYIIGDFHENPDILKALVKIGKVTVVHEAPACGFSATGIVGNLKIVVPLPAEMAQKELLRLEKEREKTLQSVEKLKQLLGNPDFHAKANPELVEKQKTALSQAQIHLETLSEKIKFLS